MSHSPYAFTQGVTQLTGAATIKVNAATGAITITDVGVTAITGTANQITASASTGSVTLSLPQSIASTSQVTFGGVNATGGAVTATNVTTIGTFSMATSGGFTIYQSGTKLMFAYNGTNIASLSSTGTFIMAANVTAFGTP